MKIKAIADGEVLAIHPDPIGITVMVVDKLNVVHYPHLQHLLVEPGERVRKGYILGERA